MSISAWADLRPGDQLGNLEYLIDAAALADYQQAVHTDSQFPNLAADDCRALLLARCGPLPLTTVWQRQDFLRPPILGRRIQVGGWVREMRQRNHQRWLRVTTFAVDEIGTEILRSEAVYLIGGDGAAAAGQPQQPAVALTTELTASDSLLTARSDTDDLAVGDALTLGMFAIPDGDRLAAATTLGSRLAGISAGNSDGASSAAICGWLEGRIGRYFGDDFRWGGRLSVAYQRPPSPGDRLHGAGVLTGSDTDARGVVTHQLSVPIFNQPGQVVAVAGATVKVPSPRTL